MGQVRGHVDFLAVLQYNVYLIVVDVARPLVDAYTRQLGSQLHLDQILQDVLRVFAKIAVIQNIHTTQKWTMYDVGDLPKYAAETGTCDLYMII